MPSGTYRTEGISHRQIYRKSVRIYITVAKPHNQLNCVPAGRPSTNATLTSSSVISPARIIPWLSTPQRALGARFATTITFLPISSSGLYHFAIPEATVRGVLVPSLRVSSRSFFARLMGLQSTTSQTRSSTFAKSS